MNITLIEEWRPVPFAGISEYYEVSNLGRVRSLDRICYGIKARTVDGKVLRPSTNKFGYKNVNLFRDRKSKSIHVHRLVALAFIPNPSDLPMVNHIDGVKANNVITNLDWVSDQENRQHAIDIGKITRFKKLLTPDEVAEIRQLDGTMSQSSIAMLFGCTQSNISLVLRGVRHKDMAGDG
jgi:hypothetical protein